MPRRWTGTWQVLRKDLKTESVSLVHHNEASGRAAEAADVDFLTVLYVGGQGAGRAGPFRASVLGVFSPCRHAVDPPCESVTNLLLFLQGLQSYWTLVASFDLNRLFKDSVSKYSSIRQCWGLEHQHRTYRGHNSACNDK